MNKLATLLLGDNPDTPYDTELNLLNELKYQYNKFNSPFRNDKGNDYDLRGFYKKYGSLQPSATNGHLSDEFKKPNHITFSVESKYSSPEHQGGQWLQNQDGSYTFFASPYNLTQYSPQELQNYFNNYEIGNKVVLPEGY